MLPWPVPVQSVQCRVCVHTMLGLISKYIKDASVLRRLLFAVVNLPQDLPNFWGVVLEYATKGQESRSTVTAQQVQMLIENMQELDSMAFTTDRKLLQDLMELQVPKCKALGIVLISGNNQCILCGSGLRLRKDRPAPVVVYDREMGTVPGSHFHKYCTNQICGCTQYYGFYTPGQSCEVVFNPEWASLPFFVSSRESVFSMTLLEQFNAEIIVGQLSFKQCADVYNFLHEYNSNSATS